MDPEGSVYSISRHHHEVDPFPIPADWRRWVGIDWGARSPHILWVAESPMGQLFVYRELAPRRKINEGALDARDLIRMARDAELGSPESTRDAEGEPLAPPCEVWQVADNEDPVAIYNACEAWRFTVKADKRPGSVRNGVDYLETLLARFTADLTPKTPVLQVLRGRAPVLLEEMEGMRWGPASDGDQALPSSLCPDHGPDALRYLVMHRRNIVGE